MVKNLFDVLATVDWVTIATLVTAAAALFTILEMRVQRLAGLQPDLVIEETGFAILAEEDVVRWGTVWLGPLPYDEQKPHSSSLKCLNIGPGPAKHVTYKWDMDVEPMVGLISAASPLIGKQLTIEDKWLRFEGDREGANYNLGCYEGSVTTIAPNGAHPFSIEFPRVYTFLLGLYAWSVDNNKWRADDPPPIELVIDYRDLANRRLSRRFKLRLHFTLILCDPDERKPGKVFVEGQVIVE